MNRLKILAFLLTFGVGILVNAQQAPSVPMKPPTPPEPMTAPKPPEPPSLEEIQLKLKEAQQRMEEAVRDVTRYSTQYYTNHMPDAHRILITRHGDNFNIDNKGAMLGVHIDNAVGKNDERLDGVNIVGVTPNGPAEKSGLQNGDRIVALNGESLQWRDDTSPVQQLLTLMAAIEPEQSVTIDYERDGSAKSVLVNTERLGLSRIFIGDNNFDFDGDFDFNFSDEQRQNLRDQTQKLKDEVIILKDHVRGIYGQHRQPWHDLELISLNPKLGSYFNTDKGVLVVNVGDNSGLALEEGDVIIDIDGREPKDPAHVMRILNSYQPGDTVKLNILRERRKRSVEIKVEEKNKNVGYWYLDNGGRMALPGAGGDKIRHIKIEKRDSI